MITTSNISMQFGSKPLFESISVAFSNKNRYGLIGANGSGKSTFMKILTGELEPTAGTVTIDKNKRVSKLNQDQFAYEDIKVSDCVIMGHDLLWEIKNEREKLYSLPEMTDEQGMKVAELEVEFGEMDGYTAEANAEELLLGLGIPIEDHDKPMSSIAPGLKLRVLLAQALFGDPGILLLDEPTNNLDINTIRWLENTLKNKDCLMIVISHDRRFLNSVCTNMADLDYGEIRLYNGNYDDFMIAATMARETLMNENAKKQAKIKELQSFVSRFSANASKAKQATSRANQINKIKLEDIKSSSRVYPFIRFKQEQKVHNKVVDIENISKSYDDLNVIKKFNITINTGDRIGIVGENGIGKTTLLKCIIENGFSDSGIIKWSENASIGYFAQNHSHEFKGDISLIDWMAKWSHKEDDLETIRGTLGRLLFNQDDINKPISVLSGGEQRRMLFGKIILQRANVIILDEPTNHLDMESIEALNHALSIFEGTIIFVSHDREFISSLSTRLLEVKEEKVVEHSGGYDSYRTVLMEA
ncbi:MAG: ABC-F family ATPase [Candidatus Marinimicrobia bacterium]|nr:ABC-F family ATPase [Candidatus Neomarinimicrobiota bacterium]